METDVSMQHEPIRSTGRIVRFCGAALLAATVWPAGTALAQPPLYQLLDMMPAPEPDRQFQAGLAGCLLGGGDGPATAELFAGRGMAVYPAPEMGIYEIAAEDGALYVLLAIDGGFCDVSSHLLSTEDASALAEATLFAATGLDPHRGQDISGCLQLTTPGMPPLSVQSDGQDPVCLSATGASVRFHFHE